MNKKLAPQKISKHADEWISKESFRLGVSRAEVVRRLLDLASKSNQEL